MPFLRKSRSALLMSVLVVAPSASTQSDGTAVRFSAGGGFGQYELINRNCDGEVLSSQAVDYKVYGAHVDVRPPGRLRIEAFAGTSELSADPAVVDGGYGGFLLAAEWERFALGAGWARFPGEDLRNVPTGHFRIGGERSHFRADVFTPSSTPVAMGLIRGGYGFTRDGVQGVVGIGVARAFVDAEGNGGPFADLAFPIADNFDALVRGSWHFGEIHADWGAAVGAQYRIMR